MHDTYGDRFGTRPGAIGLLSRRAKSFEYESISSNIFSDDSLRTARRKLKRNLSLSDAGYGDKIPALGDRSKSYYDSNGDDKVPTTTATTTAAATGLTSKETGAYDYLLERDHKPAFYGYDSELSCGETEIYVPSFDKRSIETVVERMAAERNDYGSKKPSYGSRLADNGDLFPGADPGRASLRDILDEDDTGERKYNDGSYLNHEPTSWSRDVGTEKRTRSLECDLRSSINNPVYSSIEDALLSSSERYERHVLARSATRLHDTGDDDWMTITKDIAGRGYQGDGYKGYKDYKDWDADYDEGFVEREKIEDLDYREESIEPLRSASSMYKDGYFRDDLERTRAAVHGSGKRYAQPNDGKVTTDYISYRPVEDYDYRTTHSSAAGKTNEGYEDGVVPMRRRRRRSRRGSREGSAGDYESPLTKDAFKRPTTMAQQLRTESTPVLHSDDEPSADRNRRAYRRRRNSSCPESRDLRMRDGLRRDDERTRTTSHFMLDSDEEFGSMETVVGADYFRRTSYVTETRANDHDDDNDHRVVAVKSGFFHAGQDRASYLDARYDYEGYQDRHYSEPRELVRSGSQRSSCSREPRHATSRARRKSSCPECRELALYSSELGGRSGSLSRRGDDRRTSVETRHRYRRRNSSCPEARDLEMFEKRQRQQHQRHQQHQQHPQSSQRRPSQLQQHPAPSLPPPHSQPQYQQQSQHHHQQHHQQQQQGSKRNVAISDTLEYYEYSMESESQCSENCGFGPCDPRRPRNRAPRPGNANSSLFDSQTATSDTAKNYHPRADDHHHQHPQNTKTSPLANVADVASTFLPSTTITTTTTTTSGRRRSRKKSAFDIDVGAVVAAATSPSSADRRDDDARNRRSSSMPESSEYSGQSSSYEKTSSRHQVTDNGHDEHSKRSQFTRSLSNADVPQDEKDTGSFSDTAIALNVEDATRRGRKSSPGSKSGSGSSSGSAVQYQAGLGKKSNSTSQLSATGRKRRLGFGKKGKSSFTVHRSEEILPEDTVGGRSGRQPSSASSDGEGSGDGDRSD